MLKVSKARRIEVGDGAKLWGIIEQRNPRECSCAADKFKRLQKISGSCYSGRDPKSPRPNTGSCGFCFTHQSTCSVRVEVTHPTLTPYSSSSISHPTLIPSDRILHHALENQCKSICANESFLSFHIVLKYSTLSSKDIAKHPSNEL